jgi:hypothetical protein
MVRKNLIRMPAPLLRSRMSWVTAIGIVSVASMGVVLLSTPQNASSTAAGSGLSPAAASTSAEPQSGPRAEYYPSQFPAPTGAPEEPIPTF